MGGQKRRPETGHARGKGKPAALNATLKGQRELEGSQESEKGSGQVTQELPKWEPIAAPPKGPQLSPKRRSETCQACSMKKAVAKEPARGQPKQHQP